MSHLCSKCTAILERASILIVEEPHVHHQQFSDFKQAVDQKCYICVRLWKRIYSTEPDMRAFQPSENVPYVDIKCSIGKGTTAESINIWFLGGGPRLAKEPPIGFFTAIASKIAEGYLATFALAKSTTSRCILEQARQWLSTCHTKHRDCSRSRSGELPTRLVVVGRNGLQLCARLCDSLTLPPGADYLTLSHCWGDTTFFTLRKQNLEQLRQSIPIFELPRVFQDAILITHELGFSYIWIDSLCIIQDAEGASDWLRESLTMDRVYGNSACNLAATGFYSGQEGLLPLGDSSEILPPIVNFGQLGTQISSTSYRVVPADEWGKEITQSPLHCRGWVYQEQILAPRILHFGRKQVFWECYVTKSCEVFPDGFPPYGQYIDNLKGLVTVPSALSCRLHQDDLYRQWLYLVREYSRAHLTYPTDKLPALSGLAKVFTFRLKDNYLAGLWRRDLFRGILWSGGRNATAASTYRAPTWSWASIDGFTLYPGWGGSESQWKPLARTLCAVTTPLAEDVTGQLTGGYLRIFGPLRKVTIQGHLEKANFDFRFTIKFLSEDCLPDEGDAVLHLCKSQHFDLTISPSTHDVGMPGEIFLMPLICLDTAKADASTYGLVLCPKEVRGAYQKIGTFKVFERSTLQSLFFNKHSIEDHYYEEFDGATGYTIRIL